jgi:hypothetical protein
MKIYPYNSQVINHPICRRKQMKRLLSALLVIVALPVGLSAACATCKGPRTQSTYGRPQQYSTLYEYDAKQHSNSTDHYVTEDDRRIATEVRDRIQNENFDNPNDVQIFVEYGKVILEGKTTSNDNKQAAEEAASEVHGVRNVVNGLYVDNRQPRHLQDEQQDPQSQGNQKSYQQNNQQNNPRYNQQRQQNYQQQNYQQQNYPQQNYPQQNYQQQNYPQQNYQQQNYPQQNYQQQNYQQQNYPQQNYPQQNYPQQKSYRNQQMRNH